MIISDVIILQALLGEYVIFFFQKGIRAVAFEALGNLFLSMKWACRGGGEADVGVDRRYPECGRGKTLIRAWACKLDEGRGSCMAMEA